MTSGPIISRGKNWKKWQILFSWAPKSLWTVTVAMKLKDVCSLEEKLWPTSVQFSSVQFNSVTQSCLTPCDPMNCSTPGLPVHHQLPEFTQTHVHWVNAIQPSHPRLSPSPPAPNPSQHQSLFQWVNCSHEVAKVLDSILNNREFTLPRKIHLVKAMVFPVVMYGCESWTTKKAECWRIDAFNLWCWRRLLRVPYMQSISWEMLGWMKHKLESRLLGEISITSEMQMTTPLWHKAKRN